jgi:hypothetical protein
MKKFLIIAAAGAALAAGVPAALAATGGADPAPATTFQPVQQEQETPQAQPEQQRPDRGDCPEKDGGGGESAGGAAPSATPEI